MKPEKERLSALLNCKLARDQWRNDSRLGAAIGKTHKSVAKYRDPSNPSFPRKETLAAIAKAFLLNSQDLEMYLSGAITLEAVLELRNIEVTPHQLVANLRRLSGDELFAVFNATLQEIKLRFRFAELLGKVKSKPEQDDNA